MQILKILQVPQLERASIETLKEGKNFGLAEKLRISLKIQGAGRFVQLIQPTFRQTVRALANSWLSCRRMRL